ncbi:GNAT family N-acetyltransferase [Streptococcus suis]|uniref:GNAT family N-acetyltransferase n=1 Tax=Streptococcus suis TaxID=1307 RepID=UPI001C983BF8|nr:GNAT family N-acetyltransferase [Streptococcus suis]MBY5036073.1 GNAT family N-acetyltransferase [Streptococcus suis]
MITEITYNNLPQYKDDILELLREVYSSSFVIDDSYLCTVVNEKYADMSRILTDNTGFVLSYIEKSEVLGFLWYYHKNDFGVDKIFINFIATKHSVRGRGIASQLLFRLKEIAKARGISNIELIVTTSNETAVQFYEHHDFIEYRKVMVLEMENDDKKNNLS